MSIFSKVKNKIRSMSAKQATIAGVFTLALAGAVGFGLAGNQFGSAAGVRDSGHNPIFNANNNGGIGCLSTKECVTDLRENREGDIQTIAKHFGLSPSEYSRFEKTARKGKTYRDGRVVVDGQTVMTSANSMGRDKFNSQRKSIKIGGKTYYYSRTQDSFASGTSSIDTWIMFNSKGEVETALMAACGNPTWGKNVKVTAECKSLSKKEIGLNKYEFTTTVAHSSLASVDKVVYYADGKKFAESSSKSSKYKVTRTFTKSETVTSKVYFKVPGKQIRIVSSTKCQTKVTFTPPKKPFYACDLLRAEVVDEELRKFRFTVDASYGDGATLKSADFSAWIVSNPDDKTTVTGVTQKDGQGNIYHEFEFEGDGQERIVEATVNFNVKDGVKSVKCQAKVTPEKEPVCPLPGKEHLPPNHPDCKEDEEPCPIPGKEHLPKDSDECVEEPEEEVLGKETELPKTGAASIAGIFFSATGAGAAAHRLIVRRLQK